MANKDIELNYLHDGGPFEARLLITRLGYIDGLYTLKLAISDSTDYERIILWLCQQFKERSE